MAALAEHNEIRCAKLYEMVESYDRLVGTVVNRPHGIDTARPQDYLASVLMARSFRLMIGGLWVSAGGYPELSPNLGRTIWEIGIRLYYAQVDPAAAALGFFIHATLRNLEALETELGHRRARGEEVQYLPQNCDNLRNHHRWLLTVASARGVDGNKAVEKFGRLNVRNACKEIGIEKAYLVDYTLDSGHVHERDLTTDSFLTVRERRGEYELGPTARGDMAAATFDVLKNFAMVADAAARLSEDAVATAEASRIHQRLVHAWKDIERGV